MISRDNDSTPGDEKAMMSKLKGFRKKGRVVNCHYQELISILISCCGHIAHVFISAVNCQLSLSLVSVL